VKEIHDRAEALRVYCRKHDGLMEAGNRLAGITAVCERRIGQELRATQRHPPGPAPKDPSSTESDPPTLKELGISYNESAAYQELAHPDVAENVILDAIATSARPRRGGWPGGAATAGEAKNLKVQTFGSFEAVYAELVEPWLGSWAELRQTYARFQAGEITQEQGQEEIERRLMTRSEAGKLGGRGKKAPCDRKGLSYGTVDYWKAKLRAEDSDLAARVEQGELSANAAAVQKGWRKKPDPYRQLVLWWDRASDGDRARFKDFIDAWHREREDAA
jgi:hypothetical protein